MYTIPKCSFLRVSLNYSVVVFRNLLKYLLMKDLKYSDSLFIFALDPLLLCMFLSVEDFHSHFCKDQYLFLGPFHSVKFVHPLLLLEFHVLKRVSGISVVEFAVFVKL